MLRKKIKAVAITKEQYNPEYTQSVKGKVQIYKFCRKSEKSWNNGKVCIELLSSLVKRYRELKFIPELSIIGKSMTIVLLFCRDKKLSVSPSTFQISNCTIHF